MGSVDLSTDINRLSGDMEALRKDVAAIARSVKELGAAKGHDALAKAEELKELARVRLAAAEERVSHEIGQHPYGSMLTAFGVGFAIGKLMNSDR